MNNQERVQRMLGGLTPSQFIDLSRDERNEVYEDYLVTNDTVQIEEGDDDDFFNPELAKGTLLRQEYYIGGDEAGKQIAQEAREVYYTRNTFAVCSHWLGEFLTDKLADGEPFRVDSLIRQIVVIVDIRHQYDWENYRPTAEEQGKSKGERVDPWAVCDLRRLLGLTNAKWVGVDLRGGGALNGTDAQSQEKIREIAGIIRELIVLFPPNPTGAGLTIRKVRPELNCRTSYNLRGYWDPPTAEAKQRLLQGQESFKELMQIQIAEWTRQLPTRVTVDSLNWQSLL